MDNTLIILKDRAEFWQTLASFWFTFIHSKDADKIFKTLAKIKTKKTFFRKSNKPIHSADLFSQSDRYSTLKQSNCENCNGNPTTVHHIIPIENGGGNQRKNLIVLCYKCIEKIEEFALKGNYQYKEEQDDW